MSLRPATGADLDALVAVINAAYLVEEFFIRGPRTDLGELEGILADPARVLLVLEEEDHPGVAGAVCATVDGRRGHLSLLAVDPARQGRGFGRLLVEGVVAHCRGAGCDRVELEVFDARQELPSFYAALGFTPTAPVAYAHPELLLRPSQLIRMVKPLERP